MLSDSPAKPWFTLILNFSVGLGLLKTVFCEFLCVAVRLCVLVNIMCRYLSAHSNMLSAIFFSAYPPTEGRSKLHVALSWIFSQTKRTRRKISLLISAEKQSIGFNFSCCNNLCLCINRSCMLWTSWCIISAFKTNWKIFFWILDQPSSHCFCLLILHY